LNFLQSSLRTLKSDRLLEGDDQGSSFPKGRNGQPGRQYLFNPYQYNLWFLTAQHAYFLELPLP
ncbi:hypothetical protein, partial [Endozoicomonas sp. SESOKO2]|uniref:hypothetical protein n=1 Tax=Endozoicomonas sp. SESOKO2 TaxID=2828743 RepID=UPI002147CA8B